MKIKNESQYAEALRKIQKYSAIGEDNLTGRQLIEYEQLIDLVERYERDNYPQWSAVVAL
jgi:antitoxin component HigA of HigAB toxin-antitoxin module